MNILKLSKRVDEVYLRILEEITDLVRFEAHCNSFNEEMPEQEKGRLKAFADLGAWIAGGSDWRENG